MKFAESLSTEGVSNRAVEEVCTRTLRDLDGAEPDLGFLFFSPHHAGEIEQIVATVRERTGVRHLFGCTGESIIGSGREIERLPGLSLWLSSLPGLDVRPFHVECQQTPDGFCFPTEPEPDGLFDEPGENASILLLGEPFSMPVDLYLRRFNEDHPGLPIVGGMASGATQPGGNRLVLDGEVHSSGAIGVIISGPYRLSTVVSQGCRPVGKPYVVTECDRNTILKLGGQPAVEALQEMYGGLSPEDRQLFQSAPHAGVVMNERQDEFGPGDFLIRNVVGLDPNRGSVFVSDYLRRGQTIQFHVRDGEAASADLAALLEKRNVESDGRKPHGGLVFSCNGRGTRLFASPDHDILAVREAVGEIPMSGFFAQGEVGPVGKRNHLHGFTTCVALFCDE